eukprot:3163521-Pleurochrysis_carterae.AAC.2
MQELHAGRVLRIVLQRQGHSSSSRHQVRRADDQAGFEQLLVPNLDATRQLLRVGKFTLSIDSSSITVRALNEYATCYISCYTRNLRNAKWPHVGVFGALGQVLARM